MIPNVELRYCNDNAYVIQLLTVNDRELQLEQRHANMADHRCKLCQIENFLRKTFLIKLVTSKFRFRTFSCVFEH